MNPPKSVLHVLLLEAFCLLNLWLFSGLFSSWLLELVSICHVKLMQSTALEQNRFDLQSLSPALRKLWLLLVLVIITIGSCLISGMLSPGLLSSLSPTLYPAFPLFYKREKNAFNTSTRVRYGVYIVFTYVYRYEKPRTLA